MQEEKARRSIDEIKWYPVEEHTLEKLWKKPFNCLACIEAGRKSQVEHQGRRKALADLSPNTTKKSRDDLNWKRLYRALRTLYGCKMC